MWTEKKNGVKVFKEIYQKQFKSNIVDKTGEWLLRYRRLQHSQSACLITEMENWALELIKY